ncbi:endolytic transglycosylase MltG [Texcoconibacillus texcoconensis]|uniref:Endolytic murein transglycosylase n=1 Tax=Texcoconibacillus texcoconensis TaxID=1095777 RepID=A0A840QPC0_9BACI|nr:UPF0755 protein [Texcoconibacillus texcoconensis]
MTDSKDNNQNSKKDTIKEREKEAKTVRKIVLITVGSLFLLVLIGSIFSYYYVQSALGPLDEEAEETIEVEIPIGSNSSTIGEILEDEGVIRSATIFSYYVRFRGEAGFQAGTYELTPAMSIDELIASLKDGTVYEDYELSFTIPEGYWLEETLEVVAEETDHEYEELLELVSDEEYIETLIDQFEILSDDVLEGSIRWPLEGYLFPARHDFVDEDASQEEIIEEMIRRTQNAVFQFENQLEESEYSYHEILTMASIIEGEAAHDDERATISGVLYNRLEKGMALQMDPTVSYAHEERLSRTLNKHLTIDSPYNTYEYPGLPVGPINNPGDKSIEAALMPEIHDYQYFYHTEDNVFFSETYPEHQQVLEEHRDNAN